MRLAEQRGIGLRKLKHLPEEGFPLPTIRMKAGMLEITFARTKEFIAKQMGVGSLSEVEKEGLIFIQRRGGVSRREFAEYFEVSEKTAQRRLYVLVEKGIVEVKGKAKATIYVVK